MKTTLPADVSTGRSFVTPRRCLLVLGSVTLLLVAAPASAQLMFPNGENVCLDLRCKECWCVAYEAENETAKIIELIPYNENLQNWSEMISVIAGKEPIPDVEPEKILEFIFGQKVRTLEDRCKEGHAIGLVSREPLDGHPALAHAERCRSLAPQPYLAESRVGTSETNVRLHVIGDERIWNVARSASRWDYDLTTEDWIATLKRTRICRNPPRFQECPKRP